MTTKFTFANPNLSNRFRNAITAELNMPELGYGCVLSCYGHAMSAPIPDWLILAWIEDKSILRVPNLGKTSINQTIEAIAARHKIAGQIVLKPTE